MLRLKIANTPTSSRAPAPHSPCEQVQAAASPLLADRMTSPLRSSRCAAPSDKPAGVADLALPKRNAAAKGYKRDAVMSAESTPSKRPRRAMALSSPQHDSATASRLLEDPLWFQITPHAQSVWDTDRTLCGHTPDDDAWALQTLIRQQEDQDALKQIHAMMSHLSSRVEPSRNNDLFRLLVQWPSVVRPHLALALRAVFVSPSALSSDVRVSLATKANPIMHTKVIDALQHMVPFVGIKSSTTLLRLFCAIRDASVLKRHTIIQAVSHYCQLTVDPTGQNALHLLRQCLRYNHAHEAIAFCQFASQCHGAPPDVMQPYDKTVIEAAAGIAPEKRVAFGYTLSVLDPDTTANCG